MSFGSILKELRKANRITQGELADFLRVSRPTIAGYETKDKQPDFEKLIKLSAVSYTHLDVYKRQASDPPDSGCV